MSDDKALMGYPPAPLTGQYLDSLRIGDDTSPLWRKAPNKWPWGCVEALTNAVRRYYYGPYPWALDQDCVFFAHEDTRQALGYVGATGAHDGPKHRVVYRGRAYRRRSRSRRQFR